LSPSVGAGEQDNPTRSNSHARSARAGLLSLEFFATARSHSSVRGGREAPQRASKRAPAHALWRCGVDQRAADHHPDFSFLSRACSVGDAEPVPALSIAWCARQSRLCVMRVPTFAIRAADCRKARRGQQLGGDGAGRVSLHGPPPTQLDRRTSAPWPRAPCQATVSERCRCARARNDQRAPCHCMQAHVFLPQRSMKGQPPHHLRSSCTLDRASFAAGPHPGRRLCFSLA
jgi:hypothetical protein